MSKALEALCYLDDIAHGRKPNELELTFDKEHNALRIIKRKWVDVSLLITCEILTAYNVSRRYHKKQALTQEEYGLLKETLG